MSDTEICPARDHYPMCIVWSPIPLLTWLLPFVGHLGIATSDGTIHDFIGPYTINTSPKKTGFGVVTRYLPVTLDELAIDELNKVKCYDDAVNKASQVYEGLVHNLILNNCHSHVAHALNQVNYRAFKGWNTFFLILLILFRGHTVNTTRTLITYAPSVILFLGFLFCVMLGILSL